MLITMRTTESLRSGLLMHIRYGTGTKWLLGVVMRLQCERGRVGMQARLDASGQESGVITYKYGNISDRLRTSPALCWNHSVG